MESAARKPHVHSPALPSVPSSAQLLIGVGDNAGNTQTVPQRPAKLLPAPPSSTSTSDGWGEWVMGGSPYSQNKAGGIGSPGGSLGVISFFLFIFYFSKLCRKSSLEGVSW